MPQDEMLKVSPMIDENKKRTVNMVLAYWKKTIRSTMREENIRESLMLKTGGMDENGM